MIGILLCTMCPMLPQKQHNIQRVQVERKIRYLRGAESEKFVHWDLVKHKI